MDACIIHPVNDPVLLVIIDFVDHLFPVISHFCQTITLANKNLSPRRRSERANRSLSSREGKSEVNVLDFNSKLNVFFLYRFKKTKQF